MLNFRNILTLKEGGAGRWLLVMALLIVVVWGWKSLHQTASDIPLKTNDTPDSFFSKFKSTIMDESGQIHYELSAAMLYHYSDGNRATLEFPVIKLFENGAPVWQVRANAGTVINDGEQFEFQGDVYLLRQTDGTSLKTEALTVWPNQSKAETDVLVTLKSAQGEVKAVGMQVDLLKERLTLLSQVRGRYESLY